MFERWLWLLNMCIKRHWICVRDHPVLESTCRPPPLHLKVTKKKLGSKIRNVLKRVKKNPFFLISSSNKIFISSLILTYLQTWFRNANQWYSITNWLGGFNPKASGTCGPSEPTITNLYLKILNQHVFFLWFWSRLYKSDSEDSKKKNPRRKKIYVHFFFVLEFSETYADPSLNEIGKTKFFVEFFCLKISFKKRRIKISINGKKIENFFSQNIAHLLGPKTQFGHVCRERGGSLHVAR